MCDGLKDKLEEKEGEDGKKGEGTDEGRRTQGLDLAEGGEERDGETEGLNKKRKREMVRIRLDTKAAGEENCKSWTKWKQGRKGGRVRSKKIRSNSEQRRGKKRSTGESERKKVMRETRARFVKDYVLFIEGGFFFSLHRI